MKEKIKKLLFEYSRNSRITTKELGKKIGASQQVASYLKKQLLKKKVILPTTIIDAVKFGYVNVLVGFNFLKHENAVKKEVIEELKNIPMIINIEEGKEGIDLLITYSALNLSAFNKVHSEIIHKFYSKLKTTFVFPIIVNHEYLKNYLMRKLYDTDIVLSGDRNLKELSKKELMVLGELIENPDKKIIDISDSLKIPVKSVINLKRLLEKKFIIKGYTSVLDNAKLGINRQIIFLRFTGEGMKGIDKFSDFAIHNKNIVQYMKLIGEYQIAIVVESLKEIEAIKLIRAEFSIENYLILKSDKIHKKKYLPNPDKSIN